MTPRSPRYTDAESISRADAVYERIRSQVEQRDRGRILAIDDETGNYEIADDEQSACDALLARLPDAEIHCLRIGFPGVIRMGYRATFRKLH
jgi:hypothetical protein